MERGPGRDVDDDAADTLEALWRARHSCRGFRPDPVPRATIGRIVDMAQRTASWCNAQPWQLIVTSGAETEAFRRGLVAHVAANPPAPDIAFPQAYRGVYQDRRRVCGFALYEAVGVARGDREASARQAAENFELFGAPHCAIVSSDGPLGIYGVLDCGAFVSSFLLAAESLGVATIAQASVAGYSDFVRSHFAIPQDRTIVCAISFGFEDADHPANRFRTERASLAEVVDWRG